jgi:nitroimidazol reductase NimA-like FMN-containing flavoprotein (pyridoxamine 5'-phosphate oxidase superfamily)
MESVPRRLDVLDRDACLHLLASAPIGRVGLSVDALPVVLPVNFALDADAERIVLRTAEGAKLRAALAGSVVAFQADHFDPMSHTGWSVLVRGSSRVLGEGPELDRLRRLPLQRWADSSADYWVSISIDLISGRRIGSWYQGRLDP